MPTASLVLDAAYAIGPVPRRLFGTFVEHMGRCVYTGLYEPGHPRADDNGLREDVLSLTRELAPTVVRYPGGNFVSNYRWEDGVGPKLDRPTRLDLAWHSIETNQFGLHEFVEWARRAGTEIMLAVNLGTRGLQEACALLEYANHQGGTYLSDRRIANGAEHPFKIKMWCLGNELDGPWQVGHKTAYEYGRLANETGKAMRLRLIEDDYTITNAVVVGTFLNSLLRHGDRVTIACQAQLINVIGLLRSEPGGDAWKQTIAYPFQQMRRLARGQIIQLIADSDRYDSPRFTDVPLMDASATYDAETGSAALFVANRSLTEQALLSVDLRGVHATDVRTSSTLHAQAGQDRHTSNGASHDAVIPRPFNAYALDDARLTATLPPLSWTIFDLEAARD
jgi:alpha-N-arabinofuranosidase